MRNKDAQRLHDFYETSLNEFGNYDARSVHWVDEDNQRIRFQILCGIASLHHARILDVGCGLGDLYKFLLQKNISVEYTGIDIMPEFISRARERFPEAHFELGDFSEKASQYEKENISFDYVLASGALSFKVENNQEYYFTMIKKMYSLARKGVAFNMLNIHTHVNDETFAAYDPVIVSDFCKTFCQNVQIVTDYLIQDFTMYLYK